MLSVLVSAVARTVESGLLLIGSISLSRNNFGIKIGFKIGVLGCKSDNPHPSRVESIDKGLCLEAETATNR